MKRRVGTLASYLAVVALISSCLGDPTGPGARTGSFAVAPRYPSLLANALVDIAAVRLVVTRTEGSAPLVDTVVVFQANEDSLAVTLTVPLDSRQLDFLLTLAMTDAQGDTIFRAGPLPVRVGTTPLAVRIARPDLVYVGVGSNATAIRFVNPPLALLFGQSATLVAEAVDGQGTVIPGTPIGFQLVNPADTAFATIADPAVGTIVAHNARGTVQVRAATLTNLSVTRSIVIQPTATNVIAQSGGGQTGTVGQALAQPLVARVRAADGLGVAGVPVTFEVLTGGGSLNRLVDTTDVNGDARATLTLGTLPGAQTARAVVPSLGGAVAGFSVTGVAGAATQLVFGVQPVSTTSGIVLAPAVTARARDQFGNDVTGFTGNVTVALQNNPSGAVLLGTLTRAAVAGVATFNDLALTGLGTGITLRATSGALTAATSAGFNITVGPAAALAFAVQPVATAPGIPFAVAVEARDAGGNRVTSFTSAVGLAIGANPSGGTLTGPTSVNAVAGVATFAGLSIDNVGSGYTLVATRTGLTPATSSVFAVAAPAGVNAWINTIGGNWSTPGNWSRGTVPVATDTVWIRQTGTYTVTLDAAATVGRMLVGGTGGTQTLEVSGAVLTLTDSVLVNANGAVLVSGGGLAGTGAMAVASTFSWTAGDLAGNGARVRVLAGGTLAIGGTAARAFSGFTLENAGTGTWTGTQTINSGNAATLRVLAGGTLAIQGDPSLLYTLGGAAALVENLGTLTRSVSTGTATVGSAFTNSGTVNVATGALDLRGGGTLGGSFGATLPAVLRFSSGTFAMQPGFAVTGTGTASLEGATLAGLAAPDTVNFGNLLLQAGALNPGTGGVVRVNGTADWSGAASLGGGGTLRVAPAATLTMSGTATRQLVNHTLANDGTVTWSGTFALNSGTNARIRNIGTFTWAGNGSYLYSLGGGLSVFENLGTVRRTGAGVAVLGAQLVDTLGTAFDIQAGELQLGNGGRIAGTRLLSGGTVELAAGTLSMKNGTLWSGTGGYVRVTGGTLTLDSAATVTMPRLDLAGGLVTHEGLLDVTTTMNWSGGDLTSNTAGAGGTTRVRAGGLLTVSGAANRQFTGTHLLQLLGNTNFTATGSINAGSGAVIGNSGLFDLQGSGSILYSLGGAATQFQNLAGATLRSSGATTGQLSFPIQNNGALSVTGDSLRLSGGSVTAFAGTATVTANALVLAGGTFTMSGALTTAGAAGNLVVGGTLTLNSNTLTVGGSLATVGAGAVQGTTATSLVNVAGNAAFGGGASSFTAGQLQLGGSFTQAGATNSFVASGTHRTVLNGSGTQNISFASPTVSRFNRLDIAAITRNIVLQTNALVADTLIMQGGAGASTLIGAGTTQRLTANGALVLVLSTASPRLAPPVLEINSAPAVGNIVAPRGLNPDTAVFIGGNITALPTGLGYNYKSIRVGGAATFSFGTDTIAGDLHIASTLGFFNGSTTFRVGGKLRVTGTGQLAIFNTDTYVTVVDSAIFAGGTTNGALTAGNLTLLGAFVQGGGDPAAFSATGTLKVSLAGTGLQQVRFTNADSTATTSHFADLEIANSSAAGVQFLSPVFAVNQLRSLPGRPAISRVAGSSATPLTINGILADSITFDGVPLRIAGTAALTNMSVFTFQNMNPAVNQFTITRAGLVSTFFPNQVVFSTVPNAGSYYLVLTNTSATGLGLAVSFFNSSPVAGSMTGRYQRVSAPGPIPVLTWNGTLNP